MPRKKKEEIEPEIIETPEAIPVVETIEANQIIIDIETEGMTDVEIETEEPAIKTVQKCECNGPVVIVRNRLGRIKICKDCGLRK